MSVGRYNNIVTYCKTPAKQTCFWMTVSPVEAHLHKGSNFRCSVKENMAGLIPNYATVFPDVHQPDLDANYGMFKLKGFCLDSAAALQYFFKV